MEIKRIIKLRTSQGLAKRIDFPNDFNELIQKTESFLPIDETSKKYQFIEEKQNREIRHQEDFELMSKNYKNEKTTKILVNIIEKEDIIDEIPLSHVFPKNSLNEESINISISPNIDLNIKKDEEDPEDKIKNDIKELVRNKMKDLEDNIVQDIYKSIKTQMNLNEEKYNIELNQNELIHKDIKCNQCNEENIKGIRYKCLQCQNFNLCSNCEAKNEHDPNHIFIKIRKPLKDEEELLMKENRQLKYKNNEYNYSVNIKDIIFNMEKKENDMLVQQITLKNIGNEAWRAGTVFKCLSDSKIKGNDFQIECKVNKDQTINIELIFDDIKDSILPSVNEYLVYYQMFNSNNEAFGNISKFRILFQN